MRTTAQTVYPRHQQDVPIRLRLPPLCAIRRRYVGLVVALDPESGQLRTHRNHVIRQCGDAAMRRCGDAAMRRCGDAAMLDGLCMLSPFLARFLSREIRSRHRTIAGLTPCVVANDVR
jgi:hypothetical protein